jgi:hypothetical protein
VSNYKSGYARNFTNIERRASARQGAEGKLRRSGRNITGTRTILCQRQKLSGQFKRGDFSTCGAPSAGRPKTVTTQEIIDKILQLIL